MRLANQRQACMSSDVNRILKFRELRLKSSKTHQATFNNLYKSNYIYYGGENSTQASAFYMWNKRLVTLTVHDSTNKEIRWHFDSVERVARESIVGLNNSLCLFGNAVNINCLIMTSNIWSPISRNHQNAVVISDYKMIPSQYSIIFCITMREKTTSGWSTWTLLLIWTRRIKLPH